MRLAEKLRRQDALYENIKKLRFEKVLLYYYIFNSDLLSEGKKLVSMIRGQHAGEYLQ